jgi:hypothetical protein
MKSAWIMREGLERKARRQQPLLARTCSVKPDPVAATGARQNTERRN